MTIGPHLLGRNLEHDPRSRNFRATVRPAILHPVTHSIRSPHLDQADIGSCEGDTGAEWLNCTKAIRNRIAFWNAKMVGAKSIRRYLGEGDALALYSKATQLDNDDIPGTYPPEDTGTSGVGIAKAMVAMGAIERYTWTFTMSDFLGVLQRQPVMIGINWYDSMFEHDRGGFVIEPKSSADPVGGHAVLAFSMRNLYSDEAKIGFTNHWVNDDGTPWGVRIGETDGAFWMRAKFFQELLIHQKGDSLVPVIK